MADIGSLLGAAGIGSTIGKAVVQLDLDTGKYATELKAAEGQTVAGTSRMGSGISKFGSIASTAFVAVGAAAVAGLGAAVGAAIEAQEAQERLHNTIQNAPQLAASAEQAFLDQAEAIRSVTGADDEAIISGEALLGNMGLLQDQITTLAPLVVDLATKYDIDLQAAFKAVGKASTGSTGALSRYVGAIEAGKTPAETFANVLEKLGGAEGFAADQAKNEPWRLLKSDMEEIGEEIGTALLPAIRSLADGLHNLIPLIEGVAKGIRFLPLIQMSEDLGSADNALSKFANSLIDTIPVLGAYVDLDLGAPADKLTDAVVRAAENIPSFRDALADSALELDSAKAKAAIVADEIAGVGTAATQSGKKVRSFAHMTGEELQKWADTTEQSFGDFVLALDETTDHTKITRKEFRDATNAMLQNSRDLSHAMRTIAREKWINDEYIQFLSEQGPEWLIGFANLTETQQRRMQEQWEKGNEKLSGTNVRFEKMIGLLDDLDSGTTRHTVEIHYRYVGFDPSKPGMSAQQR